MDLKQHYLDEVYQIKQERIKRITKVAKHEFAINGIKNTKMSTIAREAQVGEASLYRYFIDKIGLIKLVANDYWREQIVAFDKYINKNIKKDSSGIDKIQVYLGMFIEQYHYHKDFLKFMEDFENYYAVSRTKEGESDFFEYIYYLRKFFINFFEEGIEDGTIDPNFDTKIAYEFIAQVMVSTTQKMAFRLGYSHAGNSEYALSVINTTIDMFIKYITNKKAN